MPERTKNGTQTTELALISWERGMTGKSPCSGLESLVRTNSTSWRLIETSGRTSEVEKLKAIGDCGRPVRRGKRNRRARCLGRCRCAAPGNHCCRKTLFRSVTTLKLCVQRPARERQLGPRRETKRDGDGRMVSRIPHGKSTLDWR